MSVYRVKKNSNYSVIHNGFLRETSISLKAKGLLAFLLSLPDDWEIHVKDLVNRCKEGETAVRNGLKELEEAGYISKIQAKDDDNNQFKGVEYNVYEVPMKGESEPHGDFPHAGNPNAENQALLSTKELSTNSTKKEKTLRKEKATNIIDYLTEVFQPYYKYYKYALKAALRVKTKNKDPDYVRWTVKCLADRIPYMKDPPSYISSVIESHYNAARYEEYINAVYKAQSITPVELEESFEKINSI
jgi:DNA-binding Lrp family transcriptional regulator